MARIDKESNPGLMDHGRVNSTRLARYAALLLIGLSLAPAHASNWFVSSKPRILKNGDKTCTAYSAKTPSRIDFMQIRQPDGINHHVIVVRADTIPDSLRTGQAELLFPDGHHVSIPYRRSNSTGSPILIQTDGPGFENLLERFAISDSVRVSAKSSTTHFDVSFNGYGTGQVIDMFEKCRRQF